MSGSGLLCSLRISLLSICIVASVLAIGGCGGGSMSTNRMLLSMSISPAAADAKNSPNGQVMFTATGVFSQPPSPATVTFVAPFSGSWSVSDTRIATIDQTGMAQCVSGQSGTVSVNAIASANAAVGPGAMSIGVNATPATLTCP